MFPVVPPRLFYANVERMEETDLTLVCCLLELKGWTKSNIFGEDPRFLVWHTNTHQYIGASPKTKLYRQPQPEEWLAEMEVASSVSGQPVKALSLVVLVVAFVGP